MPNQDWMLGVGRFLNCSRCGLTIRTRFPSLEPEHCPRCLARARVAHPMFPSPLPFAELAGDAAETRPAPRVARRAVLPA